MNTVSFIDISAAPHGGGPAQHGGEWTLVPSAGDRMIHQGTLSATCACLLADETVPPDQHGARSYWVRRQDHAAALVLRLGRELYVFTVVGPREHLLDFQREVRTTLTSQGGIAA
jgi:hypothetical protein